MENKESRGQRWKTRALIQCAASGVWTTNVEADSCGGGVAHPAGARSQPSIRLKTGTIILSSAPM